VADSGQRCGVLPPLLPRAGELPRARRKHAARPTRETPAASSPACFRRAHPGASAPAGIGGSMPPATCSGTGRTAGKTSGAERRIWLT